MDDLLKFPFERIRYQSLRKLARDRYGDVSPAEEDVLRRSATAQPTWYYETYLEHPEVRASFLQWLATDKDAANHIDPLGIRTTDRTITGSLGLDYCKIGIPIEFIGCQFTHQLRLPQAEILRLVLFGCSTKEEGIYLDGLNAARGVTLGVDAGGEISLINARIGGDLDCRGAALSGLDANQAKVVGSVLLSPGFSSTRPIRLRGAEIGGQLNCDGAIISELDCYTLHLSGDLVWTKIRKPNVLNPRRPGLTRDDSQILKLTGAKVAALADDRASWPSDGNLHLQDFVYQDLYLSSEEKLLTARDRIEWLKRQPKSELTNAQPWMQLAKVLKDAGDDDGAKQVVYEYNRVLADSNGPMRSIATFPVDLLQKQLLWVTVPIGALTALGSLVFWRANRMRAMIPTDKDARTQFETKQPLPSGCPPFNPFVYALENVLPVIKLGQDSAWTPNAQASPGTWISDHYVWLRGFTARWSLTRWLFRLNYSRLALLRSILILFGWILAGILTYAIAQQFEH
ncbi:MAG: hypothetical protein ABSE46_19340 [Terracidiphilus sp.]|jgi:hypothetical protein